MVLPLRSYTGKLRPKGVPFSSFRYNERVINKVVVVVVVVVVVASIHYYSTETAITHMNNFLLFLPIF